MENLNLKI